MEARQGKEPYSESIADKSSHTNSREARRQNTAAALVARTAHLESRHDTYERREELHVRQEEELGSEKWQRASLSRNTAAYQRATCGSRYHRKEGSGADHDQATRPGLHRVEVST